LTGKSGRKKRVGGHDAAQRSTRPTGTTLTAEFRANKYFWDQ